MFLQNFCTLCANMATSAQRKGYLQKKNYRSVAFPKPTKPLLLTNFYRRYLSLTSSS